MLYRQVGTDYGRAVVELDDGRIVVAGAALNPIDVPKESAGEKFHRIVVEGKLQPDRAEIYSLSLMMTDGSGNPLWNRRYEGPHVSPGVIALEDGDGLVVAGAMFQDGQRDLFAVGLDISGRPEWAMTYPGPGDNEFQNLERGTDGTVLVVGTHQDARTKASEGSALLIDGHSGALVDTAKLSGSGKSALYDGASIGPDRFRLTGTTTGFGSKEADIVSADWRPENHPTAAPAQTSIDLVPEVVTVIPAAFSVNYDVVTTLLHTNWLPLGNPLEP